MTWLATSVDQGANLFAHADQPNGGGLGALDTGAAGRSGDVLRTEEFHNRLRRDQFDLGTRCYPGRRAAT